MQRRGEKANHTHTFHPSKKKAVPKYKQPKLKTPLVTKVTKKNLVGGALAKPTRDKYEQRIRRLEQRLNRIEASLRLQVKDAHEFGIFYGD